MVGSSTTIGRHVERCILLVKSVKPHITAYHGRSQGGGGARVGACPSPWKVKDNFFSLFGGGAFCDFFLFMGGLFLHVGAFFSLVGLFSLCMGSFLSLWGGFLGCPSPLYENFCGHPCSAC